MDATYRAGLNAGRARWVAWSGVLLSIAERERGDLDRGRGHLAAEAFWYIIACHVTRFVEVLAPDHRHNASFFPLARWSRSSK